MTRKLLTSLLLWPCLAFGQSVQIGGQVSVGGQLGVQVGGAPIFAITDSTLPSGTFSTAYSHTIATANGTAPITCVLTSAPGSVPTGVTVGTNCVISGTPTQAGNFTFTVQATDVNSKVATATLTLSISCGPQLQITSTSPLPSGTAGQSYSFQLQASGGVAPLTWTLQSGSLDGATLSTGGLISGTLTAAGSFSPKIEVTDACVPAQTAPPQTFALSVSSAGGALSLNTTSPLSSCTINVACTIPLAASGGTAPYTFSAPGGWLPTGLSVSGSTVTGTPTVSGTFSGTLQVTDSVAATNQGHSPYSLTVNLATGADNTYCTTSGTWIGPTTDSFAALPTSCYYTALTGTPSPGATHTTTAANLLATYNAAACGDIIVVTAGTSNTGQITLPGKGCDDQHYITIEGSEITDPNFPAEGNTATPLISGVASLPNRPPFTASMPATFAPQFIAPNANSAFVLNGADHIRFIGLDIGRVPTPGAIIFILVDMRTQTATQTNHIIFDRCWIHGVNHDGSFPATSTANDTSTTRGIYLAQANHIAVIDSYFSDFYDDGSTSANGNTDAQAIAGGVGSTTNSGWGVYKVVHNHLEGASETILLGGGGGPALTPAGCTFGSTCNDDVPSDIEVRRNYLFKSLGWFGNGTLTGWPNVKNGIEFKSGARILLEANIMENCWYDSQPYCYVFDFAPKNQSNAPNTPTVGQCPSCLVEDFTARYNYGYNYPGVMIAVYSTMDIGCSTCTTLGRRGSVHDNLVGDKLNMAGSSGTGFDGIEFLANAGPMTSISFNHNTIVNAFRYGMFMGGSQSLGSFDNIIFQNQLWAIGAFGIAPANQGTTTCDKSGNGFYQILNNCVNGTTNTWTADHNAAFNWNPSNLGTFGHNWPTNGTALGNWIFNSPTASGNYLNSAGATVTGTLGFVNYLTDSGFNPSNFALTSTSPLHNAGSDGKDIGADISTLQSKIAGVKQ